MDICVQSLRETIARYTGNTPSEAEIYTLFGPTEEGILINVLGERGRSAYAYLLEIYERLHQNGRPVVFPGGLEMLEQLHGRGLRLAIATGKGAETAEISLRYAGLAQYVERVETGFVGGGDKARLIHTILTGWGLPPAQAAYVGDAPSDMHAAGQAGVLPLGAAWAGKSPLRAPGLPADWILFQEVKDLLEWLAVEKA
jgi:phosphoglycolate phosphatase-like HAD superfamily hydrolase